MDANILQTLDPRMFGQRLQEARKARGRTQQEAAEHLGVARTTLTAIEKGERRIQPTELLRLAAYYGRSIGELLRQTAQAEPFAVQFRATLDPRTQDTSELATYQHDFQRLCEDYLALEELCQAPLPKKYPQQYPIDGVAPEIAAEDVASAERNRLGLGDGPLLNLRETLEQDVGLRIFVLDLPSRVAGMFAHTEQLGGCIATNSRHPDERRRLSLAHEYAHFLSRRYQPEVTLLGHYRRQPDHERFAEAFARAFLLPATGLSRRFHEIQRSRGEGRLTPADLCRLAYFYFVSVEALTRRLEELRLIKSGTWDRLQDAGFKVREAQALLELPARRADDQPLPLRYRYLAAEAFGRGDLSEGQFARFLRTDRVEARRLAAELAAGTTVSDEGLIGTLSLDLGEPLPQRNG